MQRLSRAWSSYWLAPGGRYTAAGLRIAIASSLLLMLWHYGGAFALDSARYYQHGLWWLYPAKPTEAMIAVITYAAWASTVLFLVGWRTRTAQWVSLISTLAIATLGVSDTPSWSHRDVPPMLVMIAFAGARAGDAWSIDAWLRKRRGELPPPARQTSARLVLVTVASVFVISGFWKLRTGGLELGWALSDNMRHQLLVRFDWINAPRTALADWLVQDVWRYRLVAVANMVSQLAPAAAPFLGRFPKLRAVLAIVFVLEVLGLGFVMDLWNLHWLPLAAAFIDFDALVAWWRGPVPPEERTGSSGRWHLRWVTVFVVFYAAQAVVLNQRLRMFPFSSFPLFAEVRSKKPYLVHQSYEVLGGHIEVVGNRPLNRDEEIFLSTRGTFRWMWRARDPKAIRHALETILTETRSIWPSLDIRAVKLSLAVFQAPAYPAPARLERHDIALLGELALDGTLRTALGALDRTGLIAARPGITYASAAASRDLSVDLTPVAATVTPEGLQLAATPTGSPVYTVVIDSAGAHWLAGFRSALRW